MEGKVIDINTRQVMGEEYLSGSELEELIEQLKAFIELAESLTTK